MKLNCLEIKDNNINNYIAKFENLLARVEIPCDDVTALLKFKAGLCKGVYVAILKRETWPTKLNDWQQCTRNKVQCMAIMKESIEDVENNHLSTKQAKWHTMVQQFRSPAKKRDEVVPMKINLAQIWPTNLKREAKNALFCKKGRCYKCKKQRHIKKNCSTWEKKGEKPLPYQVPTQGTSHNHLNHSHYFSCHHF